MPNQEQVVRCTAPKGMFLLVHVDPRDDEHTPNETPMSLDEVQRKLQKMLQPQQDVVKVFNDQGEEVLFDKQ
ncbi:MAG: hypothetical protein WD509_03065 [Candidatus Paceibacterota bacterium]